MAKGSTLAKLAKAAASSGTDVTALIEAAGVVVAAANVLLKEAKPILDSMDTEAIAAKARMGVQAAAEGAGRAGKAAAEGAGKAGKAAAESASKAGRAAAEGASKAGKAAAESAEKAGKVAKGAATNAADTLAGVFSRLGEAKDGIFEDLAKAKSEKELRNAIKDARQTVLENATTSMTVAEYAKAKEKAAEGSIGPINDMPGCFVIATYKKMDFDKDYTDYTGIYIGQADNAAEGVELAMSREGNPDVYADVKYRQNVRFFVYNCMPENLEERYFSLMQTFSDERSYN